MRRFLTLIVLLFLLVSAGRIVAETPVRTEETIYSIAAFSGRDFALTFAREDSRAVYLYADADNFVSVKKNFLYFWPITGQWMVDDSVLDVSFEGVLEITGQEGTVLLEPVDYTYFNVRGRYQNNWRVVTDEEAHREWDAFVQMRLDYQNALRDFNRRRTEYQNSVSELFQRIIRLRDAGQPVDELLHALETMEPPAEPERPSYYTVPPARIQRGYRINLPAGAYSMRFLTRDGLELQGTGKRLVMIARRGEGAIGYDIFPADRWTQPSESNTPASVLYVDGTSELYLRPFFQNEYRDLHYNRLENNQSGGNPNLYRWVKIQQVPESSLTARFGAETRQINEQPYVVEQTQTAALGYTIVPYDPAGAHEGRNPSIIAFRIPVTREDRVVSLALLDSEGSPLPGSSRQIRVVSGIRGEPIIPALALVPVVVLLLLHLRRRRQLG